VSDLIQTLHDFATLFERLRVPYAIMGGWAVRMYGLPRPAYDVDLTIAIERERLPELYDTAMEMGFTVPEQFVAGGVDTVARMPLVKFRLYLLDRGIDVDVFLAESDYQQELMRRRQPHDLDGQRIWFVSPEDLILLKVLAARPHDLGDIEDVLLAQGDLDEAYRRRWAKELGVAEKLEEVLTNRP
jgi:predicted nucleotidyltransferase